MMSVPAWQVVTWAPWFGTLPDFRRLARRMKHLGTSLHVSGANKALREGQMLWGVQAEHGMVGIAWDWGDAGVRLPALADPMNLLSNMRILDNEGELIAASQRIVHLNEALHKFGWQRAVSGKLSRQESTLAA